MKVGITRLIMVAAIAAVVVFAGNTAAWAQTPCPTSPSYTPDFTGAAGSPPPCLKLNGSAALPTPTGGAAPITSWSGSGGIVTFQATNSFTAGEPIILSGFTTSTYFNGLAFPVLAASGSQFEIAFSGYSGGSDTGTATPLNVLQLTPNTTYQAGSAWYNTQQPITNAFSTTFTFDLGNNFSALSLGNADGIAFVIQNSGTTALGPDGCGMGFADCPSSGGITNSLAVAFKTWNDGDSFDNANSVLINSKGTDANCIGDSCTIAFSSLNVTGTVTTNGTTTVTWVSGSQFNPSWTAGTAILINGVSYSIASVTSATSLTLTTHTQTSGVEPYSVGPSITLADGNIHTVQVSYALQPTAAQTNCTSSCLDVILDGNDLFPLGVPFNMATIFSTASTTAYVGFTGGTGGGDDTQDILSWTFAPQSQSQTATVTPSTPATYSYNGGCNSNGIKCTSGGYDNTVGENPGSSLTINNLVLTAIPIVASSGLPADSQALCNSIVQANPIFDTVDHPVPNVFPQKAQCFVYVNGGGPGIDAPVMFAVTCPPSGVCDTTANQFYAALDSYFNFTCAENPPLIAPDCSPVNSPSSFGNFLYLTSATGLPAVGFLQGAGPDPNNPCTPATGIGALPLFQSNQIVSLKLGDTGAGPIKSGSTGLTSCLVATYDTPNEIPTATINGNSPVNGGSYPQGSVVPANYTCTAISTAPDSILGSSYPAAGPYLTVSTCEAVSAWTGGSTTSPSCTPASGTPTTCTATTNLDTSVTGPHTFTVDVEDSATNTAASQTVTYTVVPANQAPLTLITTSPLTYNQSEPLSVTGGSTGLGVTYNVTFGPCTITGALLNQLTATSGTGSCMVTATMAGNSNYNPVTSTPANTVTLALAAQVIHFTTNAPSSAAYNSSFTVAATGGGSGNPVIFTSSGVCSITGTTPGTATYTMSNSTGPCSVIANQAGNANYSMASPVTQTVNATGPLLSVTPPSFNFGNVNFDLDLNPALITVKNIGTATASISNVSLTRGNGTNAIDFTLINLCPSTLAAGKTCYISVIFFSGNLGPVSATLAITDNSPGSPQQVTFAANVIGFTPSSLNFGTIKVGHSSTPQSVTLTNTGTTALTIGNVSVSGANAHDFVKSSGCPSSLAPHNSCVISVTFTPSATGSRSANLTLSDNAALGTLIAPLSGKGN